MEIANKIKILLTMEDIANKYGFIIDGKGFIKCPFHGEKTASLKIYSSNKGWHCFGCGEGGSVIDFVMKLFNMRFMETCRKINYDFDLGLQIDDFRPSIESELAIAARKKEQELQQYEQEQRRKEYNHYVNQYAIIRDKAAEADKFNNIDELPEEVIKALKNMSLSEYYVSYAAERLKR